MRRIRLKSMSARSRFTDINCSKRPDIRKDVRPLTTKANPMNTKMSLGKGMLLVIMVAGSVLVLGTGDMLFAQTAPSSNPPSKAAAPPKAPVAVVPETHFLSNRVPPQAERYYQAIWGIDDLKVKYTESGEMIRLSWRVVDPAKAAALNDKKLEPFLYDPQAGVKLVVPVMEKVGQLRQSSTPVAGKSYWMAFSNSGRRVKPGDRVSVEIGQFHAINLMVE